MSIRTEKRSGFTELNLYLLGFCVNGNFGCLEGFDDNEETVHKVLGNASEEEDVYLITSFYNKECAKKFCDIINLLDVDKADLSLATDIGPVGYQKQFGQALLDAGLADVYQHIQAAEMADKIRELSVAVPNAGGTTQTAKMRM